MTQTCEFSKCSNEAEVIKYEAREVINPNDEDGDMITVKVALKICRGCADEQYDGTEEFPKTYPLS